MYKGTIKLMPSTRARSSLWKRKIHAFTNGREGERREGNEEYKSYYSTEIHICVYPMDNSLNTSYSEVLRCPLPSNLHF